MMGKQNAAVFPEPVCAHAIRSRPASLMGIAYFCTGVGFLNLHRSMFLFTEAPKSMSEKSLMGSGTFSPEVSTGMSSYASKSIPVDSPNTGASSPPAETMRPGSPIDAFASRSSASCFANGSSSRKLRVEPQPPPRGRSSRPPQPPPPPRP